jgi:hypothetical protein
MVRRAKDQRSTRCVNVYVNISSSVGFSADDLLKRGSVILAFLQAVQSIGVDIELSLVVPLGTPYDPYPGYHRPLCLAVIRIETKPLDLATAGFAIAHPAFARNLGYGVVIANGGMNSVPSQLDPYVKDYLKLQPKDVYLEPPQWPDPISSNPEAWIESQLLQLTGEETCDS